MMHASLSNLNRTGFQERPLPPPSPPRKKKKIGAKNLNYKTNPNIVQLVKTVYICSKGEMFECLSPIVELKTK